MQSGALRTLLAREFFKELDQPETRKITKTAGPGYTATSEASRSRASRSGAGDAAGSTDCITASTARLAILTISLLLRFLFSRNVELAR
jgi:hypothetical protein